MDLRLAGKSVVVTGGASNIGRAITLGFSAECVDITVAEIDLEQGEAVAEQTRTTGARSATVMQCDVTDLDQVQALFDAATANHGGVDVLVNNVGWDGLMFFTRTRRICGRRSSKSITLGFSTARARHSIP